MMSLWDALRMNMMISYQELVRTFLSFNTASGVFVSQSALRNTIGNTTIIPNTPNNPHLVNFDASRVVPTASENRPRNIAFNYIVRAA